MSDVELGFYQVKLQVGHEGMPGAPILHLTLGVNASTGEVAGTAEITQALPPPYGSTVIPQVAGRIFQTDFGDNKLLVHVTGQYLVSVPPPAIGTYLADFSAALAVDKSWDGRGSFAYNRHVIADCAVKNVSEA